MLAQENHPNDKTNGRWTKEEHEKFMLGLKLYGKNWRKIEELVVTRNGSQIRSHAQKYFMKMIMKTSDSHKDSENQNKEPQVSKQKEITTQHTCKKSKKLINLPSLNSPFFWEKISQLSANPSFSFWQFIESGGSVKNHFNHLQKSFVPYEEFQNPLLPLNSLPIHSNISAQQATKL